MKNLLLTLFLGSLSSLYGFDIKLPQDSYQLIEVVVTNNQSSDATLHFWYKDKRWHKRFSTKAKIGRNGIAWGLGLLPNRLGRIKKEGDGKSPAGLFTISSAFGYAKEALNKNFAYTPIDKKLLCIDDTNSPFYNRLVTKPHKAKSYEQMYRSDGLYEYGLVIDHNKEGKKGAGSCIFLHIMRSDASPTAGCTAIKKASLIRLIKLLEQKKKPLFYLHQALH